MLTIIAKEMGAIAPISVRSKDYSAGIDCNNLFISMLFSGMSSL